MKISLELIKELRTKTSASVSDCRHALEESIGDINKAVELLRKRGLELAVKKGEKPAKEGRVESYVHLGNKIGVLLEVNCQTDFVARNAEFCQFTKDIAMHIAAINPLYIREEDVPKEVISEQNDKDAFYKAHCLLHQAFVKDPSITINDYLGSLVVKFSENIVLRRFSRYKIGE